jgi:hypothetical protein
MSHQWPAETAFRRIDLYVRDQECAFCGSNLHVCSHRTRKLFSLEGPWRLLVRLGHCPDPRCEGHRVTVSPREEMGIAPPRLMVAWDAFAWIGHRRFARHWSVPQVCAELSDGHRIDLSEDAIEDYLRRYEVMVAARHTDLEQMRRAYARTKSLVLAIDGLQPEKGHETLYVVRELTQKRVWFAEPLLSSTNDEVRRVLARAGQIAAALNLPVSGWMSDKQEAFVAGIAQEFPGVPHRYCDNHFLRDLAKPLLEQDSHAKVQMRRKVRGLRTIEQAVLREEAQNQAVSADSVASVSPAELNGVASTAMLAAERPTGEAAVEAVGRGSSSVSGPPAAEPSPAGQVVLDYCAAVRGILNDDQGGPLHPPGLRMADALSEVRASLGRNLEAKKGGPPRSRCSDWRRASTAGWRPSRKFKANCGLR